MQKLSHFKSRPQNKMCNFTNVLGVLGRTAILGRTAVLGRTALCPRTVILFRTEDSEARGFQ